MRKHAKHLKDQQRALFFRVLDDNHNQSLYVIIPQTMLSKRANQLQIIIIIIANNIIIKHDKLYYIILFIII